MFLKKISLVNFKNFDSRTFEFQEKIICLIGNNGVGKTNMLDAIYFLAFTKSYFNSLTLQNIKHGASFFMVEGVFDRNEKTDTIVCSLKKGQKKVLKKNGKRYEKISDHIGYLPLVIISPTDRDLIIEGSETRRKFLDGILSQLNKSYLQLIIDYNKILSQRNALLKFFAANKTFDALNLKVYNEQLVHIGTKIYTSRKDFLESFIPLFIKRYQSLSKESEHVNLTYDSKLHKTNFDDLLANSLERDRVLQYTSVGPHKDDLQFTINDFPIKRFGSQGQQKTYLIALKLAQFDVLSQKHQAKPIVLLDDIFDKLDDNRVQQLIKMVNHEQFGQLFISDTHKHRTEEVIKNIQQPYKIYEL